jgi:phosphodiesterase/alkaline phosphatase D-like protein
MIRTRALTSGALGIVVGVLLWLAPAAGAAVTSSTITVPANPSFFQLNDENPADAGHQMTVSGTTTDDGTPGNVDLICTSGIFGGTTTSTVIQDDVSVNPDGSFSWTGAPPDPERPCVLRAVPSGEGVPDDLAPFSGPTVGLGDFDVSTLSDGPNSGLTSDFYDNAAQLAGDADYESVGSGGVFDGFPVDPSTLVAGADLFFSNDYLSDENSDRSDIEVDGTPAYATATAESLLPGASSFVGLQPMTFSASQDPDTGDLVINESEPLVECAPSPATYPPTATSCTSFVPSGVTFSRTIFQSQNGRQARVTDSYASADGQSHTIDLRYGQDFQQADAGFNFPWVDGTSYNTHSPGDTEPAPPTAPATVYVDYDNSLADGAENSAQGAITFDDEPSGYQFVSHGAEGMTHMYVSYTRDIPAGGSTTLTTTYSWAFTIADAQTLAGAATSASGPPIVTTDAATSIATTSATVTGTVDPEGQQTNYHFEYGTTPNFGTTTAATSAGNGATSTAVSSSLSGLQPNTTYYYRLVASNATGAAFGTQGTFTTIAPGPQVVTGAASSIGTTSATISGTVNPEGQDTSYHFDYGTSPTSYSDSTSATDAGSGNSASDVSAALTGLQANTTYYYRVVATNADGTADGHQGTLTTSALAPVVTTGSASSITTTSATISGTVNPEGQQTTYEFDYGTSPNFGSATSAASLGSGSPDTSVSATLTGLQPGVTYYYRLVATNLTGTDDGGQATFTTNSLPPAVTTGNASSVTTSSATITGTVNPEGQATTYHFDWGTSPTSYGNSTTATSAGSATNPGTVSTDLSALTPNTVYYYRLVAINGSGTTDGQQGTFTTNGLLPVVSTGSPSSITSSSATIAGTVNPEGQATTYHFDYGTSPTSYGNSTTTTNAGSNSSADPVSTPLTGLQAGTTYYYRIAATNTAGTSNGTQGTFTTGSSASPPPPPPPPPSATLKVGRVTVQATTVNVPLACTGATCTGTLAETARVTQGHRQTTVTVGQASYSIAAGASTTLTLTLNQAGLAAISKARDHKLAVTLTVLLGSKTVATFHLTLCQGRHRPHGRVARLEKQHHKHGPKSRHKHNRH